MERCFLIMIEESTYMSNKSDVNKITKMKNALMAFSAADESLLETFDKPTISYLFTRLLSRLSALCYLHGSDVPQNLFKDIVKAKSEEIFNVINAYLENGNLNIDSINQKNRELQQELLHFSRIVDIKITKDNNSVENYLSNKRIKNSKYLPNSLKVMSELITVVRSRFIQRGLKPKVPRMRSSQLSITELKNKMFLVANSEELTDFVFTVNANKRRFSKELIYYFRHLLTYLTPEEAFLSIITYTNELSEIKNGIKFLGVFFKENNNLIKISYEKDVDNNEFVKDFYNPIPMISDFLVLDQQPTEIALDQNNFLNFISSNGKISCILNQDKSFNFKSLAKNIDRDVTQQFMDRSIELIKKVADIETIECGHIHLDRKIDFDQECGFKIGRYLYDYLSSQNKKPLLFPMIDDDHVLISLKPKEYQNVMEKFVGTEYELIPESSPIIRAIVVSLYQKLLYSNERDKIQRLGNNIYININNNVTCELFEDFDGRCDNGCVFFEVGLLIYRGNASEFTDFFKSKFNLDYNPHKYMIDILNEEITHDKKFNALLQWRKKFDALTNPKRPDEEFYNLVESVITSDIRSHLNILEDYYENQQEKVRSLIKLMGIPISLVSLHFSTVTGRISLN